MQLDRCISQASFTLETGRKTDTKTKILVNILLRKDRSQLYKKYMKKASIKWTLKAFIDDTTFEPKQNGLSRFILYCSCGNWRNYEMVKWTRKGFPGKYPEESLACFILFWFVCYNIKTVHLDILNPTLPNFIDPILSSNSGASQHGCFLGAHAHV